MLKASQSQQFDDAQRDDIVMGLLRLGHRDGLNYYTSHIRERWPQAKTLILPLVAGLARVSPEDSIRLGAEYAVEAKAGNLGERLERCSASFVRHYLAVDEHLLARLIDEVKSRDAAVARWFGGCLRSYLAKPWMVKELGAERVAAIRSEIAAAEI